MLTAILLEMAKVPPLPFALGMYLPIELNVPLLAGGFLATFIGRSSKNAGVAEERSKRGTLIASGFIAGGALMGMVGAILNLDALGKPIRFLSLGEDWTWSEATSTWASGGLAPWFVAYGQYLGAAAFVVICAWVYLYSRAAAPEAAGDGGK
jgi:hypothetical protein